MGMKVFRAKSNSGIRWGCEKNGELHWFRTHPQTLQEFLQKKIAHSESDPISAGEEFSFLSPVTNPCQIICQGKNYLDHLLETGVQPKDKDFNILFTKADSSLGSPLGTLEIPKGVRLLDYEIELGLVIGKTIDAHTKITFENFSEFVVGIVVANDFSARDIQVPQRQWFKGKSFRGFCPVGPFLYLFEKGEQEKIQNLDLELKVNGEVRQKANTRQLMFKPLETLQEIQTIFDLRIGDLLLTGTPGGVAMKVKPKTWFEEVMNGTQGDKERFLRFVEDQAASGRYLKAGDRVESRIFSEEQNIDLGEQVIRIS
jgi:2-keto-4-pentenoate hydratase/2-oxohepta-3-ene-1,7-dioic acid hydratase in catechol pathway